MQAFEHLSLEEETLPVLLIRVNDFFQCEHVLGYTPVSDQINGTYFPFAEKIFNYILFPGRSTYGNASWEYQLFLLHCMLFQCSIDDKA
jgi:hypothetical protein